MLIQKQSLIDKMWDESGLPAQERDTFKQALNENIKSVSVAMIVFSFILFGAFITGLLYRNSTKGRTEDLKD